MVDKSELESLYREAQSALKGRDYVRASDLLRQILRIDENYKDTSRLLAQMVKLRRRRWYNHPLLWGAIGAVIVIVLGFVIAPRIRGFYASPMPVTPTIAGSPTAKTKPTSTPTPTKTPIPTPTSIPLAWKRISIGQEFERDKIIAFEIDPKDADVLYVSMENAGFYQSIDGGISWRPVQIENLPSDIATELAINNDHNQERGYTITNPTPDGKTRLYRYGTLPTWTVSGTSNWRVSEDNGETWSEFGLMGWPASAAITFDSEGSIYTYCDSQLCKFSPNGKQRVTLGKPEVGAFTMIAFSSYDPNTIFVAGQGLAVSKDEGLTWSKLSDGLGSTILSLQSELGDTGNLYLLVGDCIETEIQLEGSKKRRADTQSLFISTNGGSSWNFATQVGCYLIKDSDGVTLYRTPQAWSSDWIWRSPDRGKSWEKVITPILADKLTADLIQSGLLYLYGSSDYYNQYVSENYGNKWRANNPPMDLKLCYGSTLQFIDKYRPMAIDPRDGNHVFVIDNGVLLESHNSCDTTQFFATPPNTNMNSIAFDPNNSDILYAGTDGGAYISTNGGQTWNQINNGLLGATVVYSIVVDKDSNVYAATPYGIFKLENK